MRLLKICFLSITFTATVFSQNIDSLFQEYLQLRNAVKEPPSIQLTEAAPGQGHKCGFPLASQLITRSNELSPAKRAQLDLLLARPELDTSIVSPRGLFRIHYNLSGRDVPAYFTDKDGDPLIDESINALAEAFDSTYTYEVEVLGFPPHKPDDGLGGDDLYDVYVQDIGPPIYGQTSWESGQITKTYMQIDNDFGPGFPETSLGINGAMVTAAHEYHHAIQLENYGFFSSELYYYELTSTSMEEFVFDDVNDYYNYLPSYFRNPQRAFAEWDSNGYMLVLWNLYLRQSFDKAGDPDKGFNIMKRSWELLPTIRQALPSIGQALLEHGASFKQEYSNYGVWIYFTDYRADPVLYFEEGANYPKVTPFKTYEYEPPRKEYFLNSNPVSNHYLVFDLVESEFNDTLVSIVTNHDIENGAAEPFITTDYSYILLTGNEPGSSQIINEYYSKIESDNPQILNESNVFNNTEVSGGTVEREEIDYAFPQPFRYSTDFNIFIPVKNNDIGFADLNIYTAGMDLVYQARKSILSDDKIVVQWNGRDNNGKKLPTGVYIYATNSEDNITKGKIIIYND